MDKSYYECHGHIVECTFPFDAIAVGRFFGAALPERVGAAVNTAPLVRVSIRVIDGVAPRPVPPPYFPANWEHDARVTIDLVSSRAVVAPRDWTISLELARSDIEDQIVWGRWLLEKSFLILALRSNQHYGLHAGACVIDGWPVIVAAQSGVGKSTFLAHALRRGGVFICDDAVIRHVGDRAGRYWGYPRAAHLSGETVSRWPLLRDCAALVPEKDKYRVMWPPVLEHRLRSNIRATALVFLTRDHTIVKKLTPEEAVARCRADFTVGKSREALPSVESDVRIQLGRLHIIELGLSPNLDENISTLVAALQDRAYGVGKSLLS